MTTTSYFEADLPVAAGNGKADESAPKTTAEILVSSYSGEHMLYLKIIDADVDEKLLVLRKQHAVDLLAGLERAAFYLRYIE